MPAVKPVLALPIRLLWAAALVLSAFGAQAGVVWTNIYSFTGGYNGANPAYAALVQGSDGNLYGTTHVSGSNGVGTVFQISTNGVLTSSYSFTGGDGGALPAAGLVQASDGNFYGTTARGGNGGGYSGSGTVFRFSTNGALTNLYSFTGGYDGGEPTSALLQGSDGSLYGTAQYGGSNNLGTVFKITTNGLLTSLYSFTGGTNGANPYAGLVQGSDGNFYGTTLFGAAGTVFKITTNGALTTLHSFSGIDGANPYAGLVQGSDGNFYGTTYRGGTHDYGTVFKISTNGALTTLHSFNLGNDGVNPYAGLVQASDGNFYGSTSFGGGTVFKITTNGALTSYAFPSFYDGTNGYIYPFGDDPMAGLVQVSDGNLYGTALAGPLGAEAGTVFRLTVEPTFQAVTLTNGTLSLTWSTEAGGSYQLQYNSDLSSSNWINLSNVVTAAGATLSATDSVTNGPQRFYRVILSP
jgi:uncharacterized repeat protein (TIGR03803 family)